MTGQRPGKAGGRLGLLGLGGYGLGLCAVGVAGIAAPMLASPAVEASGSPAGSGAPSADLASGQVPAQDSNGARGGSLTFSAAGGSHGTVLVAAVMVPPLVTPVGPGVVSGQRPAAIGDRGLASPQFQPRLFVLPSGRTAQIRPAGLLSDGSLAVPVDPKVVGWWTGGAVPGQPFGSTVIAGHVDSRVFGLGAFAELSRAGRGVVLELRSGEQRQRFRVVSVQKVRQARLSVETSAFRQDVPNRLVVITCGGRFDRAKHRYLDNVVLTATAIR